MLHLKKSMRCCATRSGVKDGMLGSFLSWFVPSTLLVMLPKCPLCIVAYIAAITGISISVSTAASGRLVVMASCIGLLIWVVVKTWGRIARVFPRLKPLSGESRLW